MIPKLRLFDNNATTP